MNRRRFAVILLAFIGFKTLGQCPVADFSIPSQVCLNETFQIQNSSTSALSYQWEFCASELNNTPGRTVIGSSNDAYLSAFALDFIQADNPYVLSLRNNGLLYRTTLNSSLSAISGTPQQIVLSGGALSLPRSLALLKRGTDYFGLVTNSGSNNFSVISFSTSIGLTATTTNYAIGVTADRYNGLSWYEENNIIYVLIGHNTSNTIRRLKFTNGLAAAPDVSTITVTGATGIGGIKIVANCGSIYALATSAGSTDKVFYLSFSGSIENTPTIAQVNYTGTAIDNPLGVDIVYDQGNYYSLIQTSVGDVYRLSFGAQLSNAPSSALILDNLTYGSATTVSNALRVLNHSNEWMGFFMDQSSGTNRKLHRINFVDNCTIASSALESPTISFSTAGAYPITLSACNATGCAYMAKTITVINSVPPDINFTSQNICASHDVNFTSVNTSGDISTYNWSFGDLNTSLQQNSVHQYSTPGDYTVSLQVISATGCKNFAQKDISIFAVPAASFTMPSGTLCTNNELSFTNTTSDNFEGNLTYQWSVDGNAIGTNRDLVYNFSGTGVKEIKLVTSIPGCSDEDVQNTPAVLAGPSVDFSFSGYCEGSPTELAGDISEPGAGYDWNLGDGASASSQNVSHTYTNHGAFFVTLKALSATGCNNTKTKQITIYTRPVVDLSIDTPPASCSGKATILRNLTVAPSDSHVQSWLWDFGDTGPGNTSTLETPSHTYANAGNYDVSLTATTDQGCTNTWQEQIAINQTPSATWDNTPACIGVATDFTASGSNIAAYHWEMGSSMYETANAMHTFNTTGAQAVMLRITGTNNCIETYNQNITVPLALTPDFTVTNNCAGYSAAFTDITSGADPVTQQYWDFSGAGTATGTTSSFNFSTTGNKDIQLQVTAQSGCVYTRNKTITIATAPAASFNASPDSGPAPLEVQFTNTSSGATAYQWAFQDGSGATSTQVSPTHIFSVIGQYQARLTASTPEGCESNIEKSINVAAPAINPEQCPLADFTVAPEVCLGETFHIQNNSTGGVTYNWEFCTSELNNIPAHNVIGSSNDAYLSAFALDFIWADNPYVLSIRNNGSLYRTTLNASWSAISGAPQQIGLSGGALALPRSLALIQKGTDYFGLVTNSNSNNFTVISFGLSIGLTAAATNYAVGVPGDRYNGLSWYEQNNIIYALVGHNTGNTIRRLKFTNGLGAAPDVSTITVTGATGIGGIKIVSNCGSIYALATSAGATDKVFYLSFSGSIENTPTVAQVNYTGSAIDNPLGVDIAYEQGNYYALIQTGVGNVYRLSFGAQLSNAPSSTLILDHLIYGASGTTSNAIRVLNRSGEWMGFFMDQSGGTSRKLYRFNFVDNCTIIPSDLESPTMSFTETGIHPITLSVCNNYGCASLTKTITVRSDSPPDIDLRSQNICVSNDVFFTSVNTSGDISSYNWSFGDLNASNLQNPVHQYNTPGDYTVSLQVVSSNGCNNFVRKSISIFMEPDASFTLPSGVLCTNNELAFTNTTPDGFAGNLLYLWYVDGTVVSANRDLIYDFSDIGAKEIKLVTSIPGCSDQVSQNTSDVQEGPTVDFSFTGQCEDALLKFTSQIEETVLEYEWSFADGTYSNQSNPEHTFSEIGTYAVTLSALSPSGCNNSKTRPITIYTKPVVDLEISPPPLSCSGSPTLFTDLTADPPDTNIQFWFWTFGDSDGDNTSTLKNPEHTFVNAGEYTVSLTATTDAGCTSTKEKQVTITQSPVAVITHTPSCFGVPVDFNAVGDDIDTYYWETGTSYYETSNPTHIFNITGEHLVKLTITGSNQCTTVYNQIITVPLIASPDFSVTKNCVGSSAVFTDITSGVDPVVQRSWDFAGQGTASDASPSFEFATTGSKNVRLTVTTQAGCSYTKNKAITIVSPPVAGFSASPESGAAPLDVRFTNTSTGAAAYSWVFRNESEDISDQVSPSYTFNSLGEFQVELTATNAQGCKSVSSKKISTLSASADVELNFITVSKNADGTLKVIITVQNKGNTIIRDLPVVIDLSGNASLTQVIADAIAPAAQYNLILSYGLSPDNLRFLCAQTTLENDRTPEGNRICIEFKDEVTFLPVHPNPARGELKVEWIATDEEVVNATLTDSFGRIVLSADTGSVEGLNAIRLDLSTLKSGIYILRLKVGSLLKTQRIVVSGQN